MFWYLPSKVQNLALVILAALTSWSVLSRLEEDVTYMLNGDNRSLFIIGDDDSTWYSIPRYVFQILVLFGCSVALRRNFSRGNDQLL